MAIREYLCPCGVISERIITASAPIPPTTACDKCKMEATFLEIPTSFSLGLSTFAEAPLDVVIGADADRRWNSIHAKQEVKDKIRKETGSLGLTVNSEGNYAPVSEENKAKRKELGTILSESGHKPAYDNSSDAKILGSK